MSAAASTDGRVRVDRRRRVSSSVDGVYVSSSSNGLLLHVHRSTDHDRPGLGPRQVERLLHRSRRRWSARASCTVAGLAGLREALLVQPLHVRVVTQRRLAARTPPTVSGPGWPPGVSWPVGPRRGRSWWSRRQASPSGDILPHPSAIARPPPSCRTSNSWTPRLVEPGHPVHVGVAHHAEHAPSFLRRRTPSPSPRTPSSSCPFGVPGSVAQDCM